MDPTIITVHNKELRFYLDSETVRASSGLAQRMARNAACLTLLPQGHVGAIIEPIIVVDQLPGGRRSGGGWFAPAGEPGLSDSDTVEAWLGARNVANTRVAADEMRERTRRHGGTGIIAITSHSFLLDDDWGGGHNAHEFTLLHEVGHSVDYHFGLIPPSRLPGRHGNAPYQGQKYVGGNVHELAAEAYSRFFLRASSMCRGGNGTPPCLQPDGTAAAIGSRCPSQRRCSSRLQRDLQNTPAFAMTEVVFPLAMVESREPFETGRSRPASYLANRVGPPGEAPPRTAEPADSPYAGWSMPGPVGLKA
jgi:hypothetical protein